MEKSGMKMMLVCLIILLLGPAEFSMGDWDEGDTFKMHFPQLPDPFGWDVARDLGLADDWQCTENGPVSDIHFWYSWQDDQVTDLGAVTVWIYSDDPCDFPVDGCFGGGCWGTCNRS